MLFRTLLILVSAAMTLAASPPSKKSKPAPVQPRWSIVIHGGAGVMTKETMLPEKEVAIRAALKLALDKGSIILKRGGSSVDAVEAAVKVLEDDPNFNAGKGSVFTYEGAISMDAAIMDGQTRAAGAISGTTITRNPISLARRVMTDSPHVLLSGTGADEFAKEKGLATEDPSYFETPERREQLDKMKANQLSSFDVDLKYGTVGAVALDSKGHVAAATSTGGLTGKRWGRIGDSPIIGAGTYADDRACAVSATGSGEYFLRVGVAHEICARVRFKGERIVPAASAVMAEVKEMGGSGGVIVITPDGQIGWSFNTPGMYRGGRDSSGRELIRIYEDE